MSKGKFSWLGYYVFEQRMAVENQNVSYKEHTETIYKSMEKFSFVSNEVASHVER